MTSFTRIPDELWVMTLSNFDRKNDYKTISALRATSKKFHSLVEPLIYHIIVDDIGYPPKSPDKQAESLQQWAWRVAEQPKYAKS
jgi:hypothetical protein